MSFNQNCTFIRLLFIIQSWFIMFQVSYIYKCKAQYAIVCTFDLNIKELRSIMRWCCFNVARWIRGKISKYNRNSAVQRQDVIFLDGQKGSKIRGKGLWVGMWPYGMPARAHTHTLVMTRPFAWSSKRLLVSKTHALDNTPRGSMMWLVVGDTQSQLHHCIAWIFWFGDWFNFSCLFFKHVWL